MADDRIRELEIMIRLIDIEIFLARRREGRQEQANRRRRRRRQVWTREWLNRRVMFGQYDTLGISSGSGSGSSSSSGSTG